MSTAESDVVCALTRSVHAIDGSRRVGWAKSFAAEQKADGLSRDLNIARADIAILTRYAATLHGILEGVCPAALDGLQGIRNGAMTEPTLIHEGIRPMDVKSYFPEQALKQGRKLGFRLRAARRARRQRFFDQGDWNRLVNDKY
jgi:hypothetical protein